MERFGEFVLPELDVFDHYLIYPLWKIFYRIIFFIAFYLFKYVRLCKVL